MAFINSNFSSYFNSQSLQSQYPTSLSSFTSGYSNQGIQSNSWLQTSNLLSSLLGSSSSLGQNWSALLGGSSNSLSSLLGGQQNCPPPPPPPHQQGQHHGPPPPQNGYREQPPFPPGSQNQNGWGQQNGWGNQQQNGWGQQNNWNGQQNYGGQQNNWGGQQGGWGTRQALGNCQPNNGNYSFGSQQVNSGGELSQTADGEPISYTTSGGWTIDVNGDKTTFTDPSTGQTLEYSGDPHEYLNGEHVKDWESSQRTVQLPDGTKVTLSATAANGLTTNTSIYDGNRNIQINNTDNLITSDSTNYYDTQQREQAQYDGEVARLGYNADGGLIYTDLYNQDANFQTTSNYKDIARSDGNGTVTDLG